MKILRDIPYTELPTPFGLGDLYLPDSLNENTHLALTIHGGGWSGMDRYSFSGVAEFLCRNGFAVFNTEYRLTPHAPWPACGDDCLNAAACLQSADAIPALKGIHDRRLLVVGGSSGGHLALMTGLRMPENSCAGIVSISGVDTHTGFLPVHPANYELFFGHHPPFSEAELKQSSPESCLTKHSPPILLTHSIYDTVVEVISATEFEDAVRQNETKIHCYYYNRKNDGHCVWIPGSNPHRLYPDIEQQIMDFAANIF